MIARQRHRGPDGEGVLELPGVALGHCRLAILDLSDAGRQPMADADGEHVLVYNGEIYNYIELAAELRSRGHVFQGRSDSEVLLACYREWGPACLDRLRGMFAFAIWDAPRRRLFAARDRLGIKPFHYVLQGRDCLAFASEIKALLPWVTAPRIRADLAQQYLAYNLLDHEPDRTLFEEFRRLPAAHWFEWSPGEALRLRCYWRPPRHEVPLAGASEDSGWIQGFRRQFRDAVELHLRSDVPVGTCLSGGLDSSALVCAVNEELRRRGAWREDGQHTFSACFQEAALDERPYMRAVVQATGCRPHEVFPSGDQLRRDLDAWLWHQEEPVGGTGCYAQFCVARLARENGIKVLLNGQGADEQLAGYRKFILVYLRQLARAGRWGLAAREAAAFLLSPEILRTTRFAEGRRYLLRSLSEVDRLWPGTAAPPRPQGMGLDQTLAQRLEADLTRFSLPVLLRYEDRNMMAFGIESRVPFVDHVLVEWMTSLPDNLRLRDGWTKYVLREALADLLPPSVRRRKGKLGFSTPESAWLQGPLSGWVRDRLRDSRHLSSYVDAQGLQSVLAEFEGGRPSKPLLNLVFRLAVFEHWARLYTSADERGSALTAA
jgi:asparagine synthase (glutamine-hydrolysing)